MFYNLQLLVSAALGLILVSLLFLFGYNARIAPSQEIRNPLRITSQRG